MPFEYEILPPLNWHVICLLARLKKMKLNCNKGEVMMKKRMLSIILSLLALCMMLTTPLWGSDDLPLAPERVYAYISDQNPYTTWKTWPGMEKRIRGSEHGMYVTKYVNEIAYEALSRGESDLPYGSIVVQENHSGWGVASISVMYKMAWGYNPKADDWFFAMYTPGGATQAEGRVASCTGCHRPNDKNGSLLSQASIPAE